MTNSECAPYALVLPNQLFHAILSAISCVVMGLGVWLVIYETQ